MMSDRVDKILNILFKLFLVILVVSWAVVFTSIVNDVKNLYEKSSDSKEVYTTTYNICRFGDTGGYKVYYNETTYFLETIEVLDFIESCELEE